MPCTCPLEESSYCPVHGPKRDRDKAAEMRNLLRSLKADQIGEQCGVACPLCKNPDNGYCDMPDRHDRSDYSPHHCERCGRSWGWWS